MESLITAGAGLLVALSTLVYSIVNNRKRSEIRDADNGSFNAMVEALKSDINRLRQQIIDLENKIHNLEQQLAESETKREMLVSENIELMRKLISKK